MDAAARLNQPASEADSLSRRVGQWDMTETVWDRPGAAPVITTGLVADRVMMGSLLQETIRPPTDTAHDHVKRTDMLTYNRLVGQWDYVSFDARAPVGLMPATSAGAGDGSTITLVFAPTAVPGPGPDATGLLLRIEQTIRFEGPNRDVKEQRYTMANGSGATWLAHRYEYTRRS